MRSTPDPLARRSEPDPAGGFPDLFNLFDANADPPPRLSELVYSGCPPTHAHAGESEQAGAAAIAGRMNQLRVEVLKMARAQGAMGITVKEATRRYLDYRPDAVGSVRNSIGPRLTELSHAGLLDFNPKVRRERCGVYFPVAGREDEDGSVCVRRV